MIRYKRDVLERRSLSEVNMGRVSPICVKKIVEYFKNNIPQRQIAKALQISSSTVVLGGIPVHTEYRCLFFLRYEFLKYRNTGVI